MNDEQYALLDSLVMENKADFNKWRQPRMDKGYSFEYVKSKVFGIKREVK